MNNNEEKLTLLARSTGISNLSAVSSYSFAEFRTMTQDNLSWSDAHHLYQAAEKEKKESRLFEAQLLARSNPQLRNAVSLGITQQRQRQTYDALFAGRSNRYAAPGSVASMFSPAGYLTELYREAKNLHPESSVYQLDKRRPDLATLPLTKNNLEDEISTLVLSNELLMTGIKQKDSLNDDNAVLNRLSGWRSGTQPPYHSAYESVRHSLLLQDPDLKQLTSMHNSRQIISREFSSVINSDISPALYSILTEEIIEDNAEDLFKKNFGDIEPSLFMHPDTIKKYYGLSSEEFHLIIGSRIVNNINQIAPRMTDQSGTSCDNEYLLMVLKLNKVIRIYQATGLAVQDIEDIILSVSNNYVIDDPVLYKITNIKHLMLRYGISVDKALILSNVLISGRSIDNKPSQFDQLFNTPLLDNISFDDSGHNINFSLNNDGSLNDHWIKTIIKRAFQITDHDCYLIAQMIQNDCDGWMRNDLRNLSHFYMITLLANIHGLTVYQLHTLLVLSPYKTENIADIDDNTLNDIIDFLYNTTQWLTQQKWSVDDLLVMLTDTYDTHVTPEIENLLGMLRSDLHDAITAQKVDNEDEDAVKECMTVIAPYMATALQLPSNHVVELILLWLDKIRAECCRFVDFWDYLRDESDPNAEVIAYFHWIAQLVLIYRATQLSENALSVLVAHPEKVYETAEQNYQVHTIDSLMQLTAFSHWVNQLGDKAPGILSAFEQNKLDNQLLSNAMSLDVNLLVDASNQAVAYQQRSDAKQFNCWSDIDITLQWLSLARVFNIAPKNLDTLMVMAEFSLNDNYNNWQQAANSLVTGLDQPQRDSLQASLAESLSSALSGYYISQVAPQEANIHNRDDLYQYLLMDNQVSAQIKTTRIAEAIASIQLYVNRGLENIEPHAQPDSITRQFFQDWDNYNKRYSTWAGVSQLVYYPENYIDPTLRIGQTSMMNELLQSINQSELSPDTVEDTFNNYLTRFEQVANLEVISAYHANVNIAQGLTYFIGSSSGDINEYYWRSVDHSKFSAGKFAANAWSEWTKISCGINPYQNIIRPVMYKSRLYLLWLERKEVSQQGEKNNVIKDYQFDLKLAHIRYDGTWSAPLTFNVDPHINKIGVTGADKQFVIPGMYCAEYQGEDTLLVIFYQKKTTVEEYKDTPKDKDIQMSGMYIFSDLSSKEMSKDKYSSYSAHSYQQFDTTNLRNINNQFAEEYEIPSSLLNHNSYSSGEKTLMALEGCSIPKINYQASSDSLNINITSILRISSKISSNTGDMQYDLIKKFCKPGDKLISYQIPKMVIGNVSKDNNNEIAIIYQYPGGSSNLHKGRLLISSKSNLLKGDSQLTFSWMYKGENKSYVAKKLIMEPLKNTFVMVDELNIGDAFNNNILFTFTAHVTYAPVRLSLKMVPFVIEAHDDPARMKIKVQAGEKEQIFTAKENVPQQPPLSFEKMMYHFSPLEIDASNLHFENNQERITVTFEAEDNSGHSLGSETFIIPVTKKVVGEDNTLSLFKDGNGAQYLQSGVYRTRLNTDFARQLVTRANSGLDAILSMNTQQIAEPQLGKGFFARLTLPRYDPQVHGDEPWVKIYYTYVKEDNDTFLCYQGVLSPDNETTVVIFYPYPAAGWKQEKDAHLQISYKAQPNLANTNQSVIVTFDPEKNETQITRPSLEKPLSKDIVTAVQIMPHYSEPMDFSGANALYFWELFYYTPMLVAQRLLQEQNFDQANRWLKYVWSPAGYIVNGQIADYNWNVRPLLEDTSWNVELLDSVDPDAVAQNDPMHYKVATFMRTLDLLLARGDYAYRQLERDTLNEAKLWYLQALHLLGEEPDFNLQGAWNDPALKDAASQTTQHAYQQSLMYARSGELTPDIDAASYTVDESLPDCTEDSASTDEFSPDFAELPKIMRTANTLTSLFLPQQNEKLITYWQTLRQRMFNLRHNLSIDGQPLSLAIYARPADPKALLSAAVSTSQGGNKLPVAFMPPYRFPQMLDNARSMVAQLIQFGATLQGIIERQDAEVLNELLQNQAKELMLYGIQIQDKTLDELDAEKEVLQKSRDGAQIRFERYKSLYEENVNSGENAAIALRQTATGLSGAAQVAYMTSAGANMAPNIFGLAVGGTQWGAIPAAIGQGLTLVATGLQIAADKVATSEMYRRRREEWDIQRNNAQAELNQIDAQLKSQAIRISAAGMQKTYLETQQQQTQAQLEFLQRKFSNKLLYNWLRGRLAAIYFQFYDLTVSRCLMAEQSYCWVTNDLAAKFIKPGAWLGTYAGLLAGETLMLNLAQMEDAYIRQGIRTLEVERTVSLAQVYRELKKEKFTLVDNVAELLEKGKGTVGSGENKIGFGSGSNKDSLEASIKLSDLNITADYPESVGNTRRIKQISVSLPALLGPYQDIQAVLTYGGSISFLPKGCSALAVSHGMNDSGQFQLDFNDGKYLPFEGIAINDPGSLVLSFPNATGKQKALLQSLNDIILHIRYTICH